MLELVPMNAGEFGVYRERTGLLMAIAPDTKSKGEAQATLASADQAYRDELTSAAEGVAVDYQRAVRLEESYSQYLTEAQADIQGINRSRAELTKLQDDVETSRALFEQLALGELGFRVEDQNLGTEIYRPCDRNGLALAA